MSSGKNPLMLVMALSVPGASQALGLGEIHVDSALNERFAAEIDIVGATAAELGDLRASVANQSIFSRFGAERPAFLASATFKVARDAEGRPVLSVRSTESFTEPVVNFVVDLHWRSGDLVRQYTLLLDPPGFGASRAAESVPAAVNFSAAASVPARISAPASNNATASDQGTAVEAAAVDVPAAPTRKTTHLKVGAKATLRGIAWRVGERSESDLQRMMIAIFRANPAAFDGNINRLHRGALLTIPAHAELEAISQAEARREFHAQMAAWRSGTPMSASNSARWSIAAPATTTAPAPALGPATTAAAGTDAASTRGEPGDSPPLGALPDEWNPTAQTGAAGAANGTLERRVQSLEQELSDVKGLLQTKHDEVQAMEEAVARAAKPVPASTPAMVDVGTTQSKSDFTAFSVAAGLGLLASALAALYFKLRRRPVPPHVTLVDPAGAAAAGDPWAADSGARHPPTGHPLAGNPGVGNPGAGHSSVVGNPGAAHASGEGPAAASASGAPSAERRIAADLQESAAAARAQDLPERESDIITQVHLQAIEDANQDQSTQPLLPIVSTGEPARYSAIAASVARSAAHEPTVDLRIDPNRLDYNLVDLDMTAQHVQMPSVLNEQVVMKERRTNLADVLRLAIEREPDRHDLRMKLLELYYSAATTNRQAFLEVVQKFARDRDYLGSDQWDKIAFMGRQIAAENPLFTEETAADDIAAA